MTISMAEVKKASGSYDGADEVEGQQRRRSTVADLNRGKNLDAKYVFLTVWPALHS